jgi:excisionase family DNA binding protein
VAESRIGLILRNSGECLAVSRRHFLTIFPSSIARIGRSKNVRTALFLSPQVRSCRFLTQSPVFYSGFVPLNCFDSIAYGQLTLWHVACSFLGHFGSEISMKKTDSTIKLLTLAEAASILKISKRTLHRMIQNRQIPAFKVGGQWRILESRFQEWVEEEENTTPKAG